MSSPATWCKSTPSIEAGQHIHVPSHAIGHIIGRGGLTLKYLRGIPGMVKCFLVNDGANSKTLSIEGSAVAVAEAAKLVAGKIGVADRLLHNTMRDHSWTLTVNKELRTPREVHKTGDRAPHYHTTGQGKNFHAARMQAKHKDTERELAAQLRTQPLLRRG